MIKFLLIMYSHAMLKYLDRLCYLEGKVVFKGSSNSPHNILGFVSVVTLCYQLNKLNGSSFYFGVVISSTLKLSHVWTLRCFFFLLVCLFWGSSLWCGACLRILQHLQDASFCILLRRLITPTSHSETVGESSQRIEGTGTATLAHLHSGATGRRNHHAALCFVAGGGVG